MDPYEELYAALGVSCNATLQEISIAHEKIETSYSPDAKKEPAVAAYLDWISAAYIVLVSKMMSIHSTTSDEKSPTLSNSSLTSKYGEPNTSDTPPTSSNFSHSSRAFGQRFGFMERVDSIRKQADQISRSADSLASCVQIEGTSLDPHAKYYAALGVSKDASFQDIKRAYKDLALLYHPDKNKDPKANAYFVYIAEAFCALSEIRKENPSAEPNVRSSTANSMHFGFCTHDGKLGNFFTTDSSRNFFSHQDASKILNFTAEVDNMTKQVSDLVNNILRI